MVQHAHVDQRQRINQASALLLGGLRPTVRATAEVEATTVAVGVAPRAAQGYGLAVRVSSANALHLPAIEDLLRRSKKR